jgi:exodeoxyribonuclease VII small subunit
MNSMSEKKKSVEEMLKGLEETVSELEKDDIPLEQAFKLYEEGMKLASLCDKEIEKVEKKVLSISEGGKVDEFS